MIFATGLAAPETPRLHPTDKDWRCVEMSADRGGVTRIGRDGRRMGLVVRTGIPNGLVFDRKGVTWVAETTPPALLRIVEEREVVRYLDAIDGRPMLLPNDLCFGPDGLLYLTDSGILLADWAPTGVPRDDFDAMRYDGRVYQVDVAAGTGRVLDSGIRFANGIAFGPDGHLYVNEMLSGDVIRYSFQDGRPTGRRRVFANVMRSPWQGGFRGPDGMAFGLDGHLYCSVYGQAEVVVIAPDGSIADRIPTAGRRPTNVAWGPDGEHRLYVTEHEFGRIEVFERATAGLPLYYGGQERVAV